VDSFRPENCTVPSRPKFHPDRLSAANAALAIFSPGTSLEFVGRRAFVRWTGYDKKLVRKQWVTRGGQDFYPTWRGPWGGTVTIAISQLIRWVQGKPVLPLASFKWWCSETIKLAGDRGNELIITLGTSGYPVEVTCVVCGKPPKGLDWFNRDGVSGPCCRWASCEARKAV
jgi:hypothetical protein